MHGIYILFHSLVFFLRLVVVNFSLTDITGSTGVDFVLFCYFLAYKLLRESSTYRYVVQSSVVSKFEVTFNFVPAFAKHFVLLLLFLSFAVNVYIPIIAIIITNTNVIDMRPSNEHYNLFVSQKSRVGKYSFGWFKYLRCFAVYRWCWCAFCSIFFVKYFAIHAWHFFYADYLLRSLI